MGEKKFLRKENDGITTEEFYDLSADPGETRNLVGTDEHVEAIEAFRTIAERRDDHEAELLGIKSAVSQLGKI
jgi:hypothetical protein